MFRLKGSGWYETDFKTGDKKNVVGNGESEKAERKQGDGETKAADRADGAGKKTGDSKTRDTKATDSKASPSAAGNSPKAD